MTECKHGSLARQCYTCELEQRIAELESGIKQALIELKKTGTCYYTLQNMVGGE